MSQLCCHRVWDGTHEKFRRTVLLLAIIDLFVIGTVIVFLGISLYNVSVNYSDPADPPDSHIHHRHNETNSDQSNAGATSETYLCLNNITDDCHDSENRTSRKFPPVLATPYFQVVGVRIARSIQLVIYTCQFFMTILLIRGLLRTDTHSMRTWLIVTEVVTTIILLVLVLYLFGNFHLDSVIVHGSYLVFQFIMIRTVSRFIRRTEIELTQFGSIVEF